MKKIKAFLENDKGKDIMVVIIVILVGLGSFELGRLSKESSKEGIKVEYQSQNNPNELNVVSAYKSTQIATKKISTNQNQIGKNYFASSKGSKYYSIGCSAGKIIKLENRVYFTTGEEAMAGGYTLSSACR